MVITAEWFEFDSAKEKFISYDDAPIEVSFRETKKSYLVTINDTVTIRLPKLSKLGKINEGWRHWYGLRERKFIKFKINRG